MNQGLNNISNPGKTSTLVPIAIDREVIAADIVELAPTPGLRAPDFLVAKLVYKLISYRFQGRLGSGP